MGVCVRVWRQIPPAAKRGVWLPIWIGELNGRVGYGDAEADHDGGDYAEDDEDGAAVAYDDASDQGGEGMQTAVCEADTSELCALLWRCGGAIWPRTFAEGLEAQVAIPEHEPRKVECADKYKVDADHRRTEDGKVTYLPRHHHRAGCEGGVP